MLMDMWVALIRRVIALAVALRRCARIIRATGGAILARVTVMTLARSVVVLVHSGLFYAFSLGSAASQCAY